jgi:hypothetical protein
MESFRGTREDLLAVIRDIPRVLAGDAPDSYGIARRLQLRVGVAVLSQVQQDFLRKSRGGSGRDGIVWPPLKPATIAQRRTTAGERRELGIRPGRSRPSLSDSDDAKWRAIFRRNMQRLREDGVDEAAAKAQAASAAWAILKASGAETMFDKLSKRKVDILRDTGELYRSLSPGVEDQPSGAEGQIFRMPTGRVIVGTNKKTWHHRGIPGRLPARPLWPVDGTIPAAWWPAIRRAGMRGLQQAIGEILRQGVGQ